MAPRDWHCPSQDDGFRELAERIIDALLERDPVMASGAGDHRFDDRLPDLSSDAVAQDVDMLRDAADALSRVDLDQLTPDAQVDYAVLQANVERSLFEATRIRRWEWDPSEHNPGRLLFPLIVREFAPPDARLSSIAARLSAVPDALATARNVLEDCPAIHLETAIEQFTGTVKLIEEALPGLVARVPAMEPAVTAASRLAVAELARFTSWLRQRLEEAGPGGGRDPRLGGRLWEAQLWHALDTDLPIAGLEDLATAALDATSAEIREVAAELIGGPPSDETTRAALATLAADHSDNAGVLQVAKAALTEATAFVSSHDLVSIVDDPCLIMEMPEFARGVAVATCDAPGPLEDADVPTIFSVAPAPRGWSAERIASFYREYNNHMIRNVTVHEAMPGHHLQLAHARRRTGATRARALEISSPFAEGWAVYGEELMIGAGFGGPPVRLQQLKSRLRMIINAMLDRGVHRDGMSEADAMSLMVGTGFQEPGEAAGKWRRALLSSTQLSTYFVGYVEVSAIGAARPSAVSLRAWHDAMLSHGTIPPRHVRGLLGA